MTWIYYLVRLPIGLLYKTLFLSWGGEGKKYLPRGGAILASNHGSSADPILVSCYHHKPVRYLAKEELFSNRFKRFILNGTASIPLKRGSSDRIAFESALAHLEKGHWVGMFPEGTRNNGRSLRRPHTGVIRLALIAKVPIIPIGISGSHRAWPKGSRFPRPFSKIRVKFGKPWKVPEHPEGGDYTYEELRGLADILLYDKIEPLIDKELGL